MEAQYKIAKNDLIALDIIEVLSFRKKERKCAVMTKGKIGEADKGSRFSLQYYMKSKDGRNFLSNFIISASPSLLSFLDKNMIIDWKSPLPSPESEPNEEFYEYRDDFLNIFGFSREKLDEKMKKVREFWPKNGPQWDGLAVVNGIGSVKGALLIEAKSHTGETKSTINACEDSKKKIVDTFMKVQKKIGVPERDWTKEFYQLSNRIAYLYLMNYILEIPTWLVLVNFVDDHYKPTSVKDWLTHYNGLFNKMGINKDMKLLDKIIMVFPDGK